MKRHAGISLLVVAAVAVLAGASSARTWTDRKGRTVEADFVAAKNKTVTIRRNSDGKLSEVPFDNLSDADQKHIISIGNTAASPPADSGGIPGDDAMVRELHAVVAEMLKEADNGMPAEEISVEADSRTREGVEAIRRFYPEFLTAPPGDLELAEQRIQLLEDSRSLLRDLFRDVPDREFPSYSPIQRRLLERHAASQLVPVRVELLVQLMLGHFERCRSLTAHVDNSDQGRVASIEETLFPGVPPGESSPPVKSASDGKASSEDTARASPAPKVEPRWPFSLRGHRGRLTRKMMMIGVAMHNYHDAVRRFPSGVANAGEESRLSWRAHLLPYLDEAHLYDQFKLDEPWDSPHNIKLANQVPGIYHVSGTAENKTVIHVFVGENTPFGLEKGPTMADIRDMTSNTIMAVIGTPDTAAPWTKPGGIPFDSQDPFRHVAEVDGAYRVLMMDGSPELLSAETSRHMLANLIMHRDGQEVDAELTPWR